MQVIYDSPYTKTSASPAFGCSQVFTTPNAVYKWWRVWDRKNTFAGWRSPNWRACVASHSSATTPASGVRYSMLSRSSIVTYKWKRLDGIFAGKYDTFTGDPFGTSVLSSFMIAPNMPSLSMQSQAYGKFLARAYDVISPVSGGVILGELRQTLHDLRNPIKGVSDLLTQHAPRYQQIKKSAKRASRKNLTRLRRATQDQWLQTQYGLLPLMSDIDSIASRLTTYLPELTDGYFPVTAFVKSSSVVSQKYDYLYNLNENTDGFYLHGAYRIVEELQVRAKGVVNVNFASGRRPGYSWGIDPIVNFVPTLYNLIPYSFLLDYFTNLGDVISAYSVPAAAISWCNLTSRGVRTSYEVGIRYSHADPQTSWDSGFGTFPAPRSARCASFVRSDAQRSALPYPKVDFEPHFSVRRALNVVALSLQRFL